MPVITTFQEGEGRAPLSHCSVTTRWHPFLVVTTTSPGMRFQPIPLRFLLTSLFLEIWIRGETSSRILFCFRLPLLRERHDSRGRDNPALGCTPGVPVPRASAHCATTPGHGPQGADGWIRTTRLDDEVLHHQQASAWSRPCCLAAVGRLGCARPEVRPPGSRGNPATVAGSMRWPVAPDLGPCRG